MNRKPRLSRFRTAALAASLAGILVLPLNSPAAGLLVADGGLGGQLQIKEQTVDVSINNGIAVTNVTQVFTNLENRQVEALYTFPVPKKGSVSNFSMWINGREVVGEVLEKKRAREIYQSYKAVRKDPGLLEQVDYKTFEMRVFPIAAHADQKVQVTYYQELDFDNDWATYVYPLATSTRSDIQATTGKFAFNLQVRSQVPIDRMDCPSHAGDFAIARRTDQLYDASLEQKNGSLARDVVLAYHAQRPVTGIDVLTSRQAGEDGVFTLALTAGKELEASRGTGDDYVFVMDISGSMADEGKLTASRSSVESFITTLEPADRFEIILFNNNATQLFHELASPTTDTLARATTFLASQRAYGGTFLRPALGAAYRYVDKDRPLNVVILSDGMADQSDRAQLLAALKERPAKARVFCVGVGNDVDQGLLNQLANEAAGAATFISRADNFTRQAAAFRRKLTHPAMTSLKINIEGVGSFDQEPATLPNLYCGAPIRLYARYKKPGTANITITGEVEGQPFEQKCQIEFPEKDGANPEIDRIWAWHRVESLLAEGDRRGSRGKDIIDEIIRLGEAYSIATEYTSFLVLENDAEFQRWHIERRNALRLGRDRARQEELRVAVDHLRNESLAEIGPTENLKTVASSVPQAPAAAPIHRPADPAATSRRNDAPPPPPRHQGSSDFSGPHFGGGGGGGGALDPLTALVGALAGIGLFVTRMRRQ